MPKRPAPLGPKRLHVTSPARLDIDDALDYMAREASLETALRFADRITRDLERLASVGHAGVSREWVSPGLRMTTIGRYCIFFRVTPSETIILRFLHGARDIESIAFPSDTST